MPPDLTKKLVAFLNYAKASKNDNKSKQSPQILPYFLYFKMPSNTAETDKLSENYDISGITANKVMGWSNEKLSFDWHKWLPLFQNTQTEISGLSNFLLKAYRLEGWDPWLKKVKWPMHEADHSFPTSPQVNNAWNYTSTSTYILGFWLSF